MFSPRLTSLRSARATRRGFTLVEIIIVLAIIGMIAGLAVSRVEGIFGGSQTSIAKIFVNDSLKTSFVRYLIDIGDYPSTAEGLEALVTAPSSRADRWKGPYIDAKGGKLPLDPWGEPYGYRYPGTQNKGGYDVFSKGPDKAEGTEDDIGNW